VHASVRLAVRAFTLAPQPIASFELREVRS
jgi:hypothetical protein